MRWLLEKILVQDHETDGLRSGEGSIVELADGSLLLLYSRFSSGGGDQDRADIVKRISKDGGTSWTSPVTIFTPPPIALNCMSVSLLRLQDGSLAAVYCVKYSLHHLVPVLAFSLDEGNTWSEPNPITTEQKYFVVNNDRLIQMADGTLALPYALHEEPSTEPEPRLAYNGHCGLFYSHDHGATWKRSPHTTTHTPDVFRPPLYCDHPLNDKKLQHALNHRLGIFQEPGVLELSNGRLMLTMRSLYAVFRCYADGVDGPWQQCGIFEGLNVPCGPSTIRRIPGTGRLVMLYNDRGDFPAGRDGFQWRTPLSIAVSDDEAATWKRLGNLEDDSRNYCYFSLLFFGERFITSYYQSAKTKSPDGSVIGRRNLASLKVCHGPQTYLLRNPN